MEVLGGSGWGFRGVLGGSSGLGVFGGVQGFCSFKSSCFPVSG